LHLSLYPYQLRFKYPFGIAHGLRHTTDVVYVKLQHRGYTAWGEATLPPYLPETQSSVIKFLEHISYSSVLNTADPVTVSAELNDAYTGNMAAKAALDMALWHLRLQTEGQPLHRLLGFESNSYPQGTYTIGVCPLAEMEAKIAEADALGFGIFKLKLDGKNDFETIRNFRSLTNKPFAADVNQGWRTPAQAAAVAALLAGQGCLFIEQPFDKHDKQLPVLFKAQSPLPVYADEACQLLADLEDMPRSFNGINIKLMKCGGITEAYKMIVRARQLGLNILIGCMSESSVGCTAASWLTPLADYADLDGPYLISNDPFTGMKVEKGCIVPYVLQQVHQLV
jgi:L-alanine-DL-glutamate epimerase-like enolase superfamily enzyme